MAPPRIIAFMGATGSGKTSFIKGITGDEDIKPSADLDSDTQEILKYPVSIDGTDFILIDTPGFNDTYRKEHEILRQLADWLSAEYRDGRKLTGLIYLHPINKSRVEGSTRLNLSMFRKLCGSQTFANVALCTTFWDVTKDDIGTKRETQLTDTDDYWGAIVKRGAKVVRIKDYSQSQKVLLDLAGKDTVTLDIQSEMVDQNKPLEKTAASKTVNSELQQLMAEFEAFKLQKKAELEEHKRKEELKAQVQAGKMREQERKLKEMAERLERQEKELERQRKEREEQTKKAKEELKRQEELRKKQDRERQDAERKRKEAEAARKAEIRALKEAELRKTTSASYRSVFNVQCHKLYNAQCAGRVHAPCYTNDAQDAGYLRWCDHCFEMIGIAQHVHCSTCQYDICMTCDGKDRSCKSPDTHTPSLESKTYNPHCIRLSASVQRLNCDNCKQRIHGLCFHCCSCANDDFDICLDCVCSGWTCFVPGHLLHPTFGWPTLSEVSEAAGLDKVS